MFLQDMAKHMLPNALRGTLRERIFGPAGDISGYEHSGAASVTSDIVEKYGFDGDLLNIFAHNKGEIIHKWHHYIPIYDRYFSAYRGRSFRFLEIGVSKGGSLKMWREYFGPDAIIYGVDIDPSCAQYDGRAAQVRIGSQDDKEFLRSVVEEMGGIDVVLDDGSHQMRHIRATLLELFPRLNANGIYMIEDLHTSYWARFGGGYRSKHNFLTTVRDISHDMHRWYHRSGVRYPSIAGACSAVHIHDSIVVLEKGRTFPPVHSHVG